MLGRKKPPFASWEALLEVSFSIENLIRPLFSCSISKHTQGNMTSLFLDEQMPTFAPTQAPALGRSNLDRFLKHTTPSVQCRHPLQRSSCAHDACNAWEEHCKTMPSFSLSDLWMSFDEWSAYGVGVPLVLPCGETVVQYYVPYLSAIQIYLQAGSSFSVNKRRQGDESDWSDVSDGRETSSDGGSDNETTLRSKSDQWDSSSCVSSERLCSDFASSEQGDHRPDPVFEYFERGSPYNRAPLTRKINELAAGRPLLRTLNSNELLPSSWFSVAWYPIYRIPMGSTMNDLSTCFLTFHTLWTPPWLQGQFEPNEGLSSLYEHSIDISLLELEQQSSKDQERWLRSHLAWKLKQRSTLELPAFGLASYKLSGPFGDKQQLASLVTAADDWLRQLRIQHHPDFDFFASREGLRV